MHNTNRKLDSPRWKATKYGLYGQHFSPNEIVPFHSVYHTLCCGRSMMEVTYF